MSYTCLPDRPVPTKYQINTGECGVRTLHWCNLGEPAVCVTCPRRSTSTSGLSGYQHLGIGSVLPSRDLQEITADFVWLRFNRDNAGSGHAAPRITTFRSTRSENPNLTQQDATLDFLLLGIRIYLRRSRG